MENDVIMTEMLSVAEAKRRFSELIERIARGERFVVTRRGTPVLGLVPAAEAQRGREPQKSGLMAAWGALEGIENAEGWGDEVAEIVASRQLARDRDPPELE